MSLDFSAQKHQPSDGAKVLTMNGTIAGYQTDEDLRDYVLQSQGMPNGLATLDENGKLTESQLPVDPEIGERLDELTEEVTTLKRENALLEFDVKNLKEASEGNLYTEASAVYPNDTTFGDSVPSKALSGAVVSEVRGKTEAYSEVDLATLTWSYIDSFWETPVGALSNAKTPPNGDTVANMTSENYKVIGSNYVSYGAKMSIGLRPNGGLYCENGSSTVPPSGWLRYDGTNNQLHSASNVKVRSEGANLLNPSSYVADRWVSRLGVVTVASGRGTYYVDVEPNTQYTVKAFGDVRYCTIVQYNGDSFITGIEFTWSQTQSSTITTEANCNKVSVSLYQNPLSNVQFEKGSVATTYKPYRPPVTLDLSSLSSVPDIGIEGTVVDFDKKTVTWNYKKVDLGSLNWTKVSESGKTFFRSGVGEIVGLVSDNSSSRLVCFKYSHNRTASIWKNIDDMEIINNGGSNVYIRDESKADVDATAFKASLSGVYLVYELATPITKTFAELGLPDISTNLSVEGNGTITVLSDGAQASAKVDYLVKTN